MHFLHRTDRLAKALGCTVKELAVPMGVSWRTIIAGRQGDEFVSAKTWRKLEHAEREAGVLSRGASHPLLEDVALAEQSGDELLGHSLREREILFPSAARLEWVKQCRDMAMARHPSCPQQAADELERLLKLFDAAVDEAIVNLAHRHVYQRYQRENVSDGQPVDLADVPLLGRMIAAPEAKPD